MKILLAVEDETYGAAIAQWVARHQWPEQTQIRIVSVLSWTPPAKQVAYSKELASYVEAQQELARQITSTTASTIKKAHPKAQIEEEILEGNAANRIISTAVAWDADLIIVGSHGKTGLDL